MNLKKFKHDSFGPSLSFMGVYFRAVIEESWEENDGKRGPSEFSPWTVAVGV